MHAIKLTYCRNMSKLHVTVAFTNVEMCPRKNSLTSGGKKNNTEKFFVQSMMNSILFI